MDAMSKDDGGPAFPGPVAYDKPGMSLRDWFAGKALLNTTIPTSDELKLTLALEAFAMADAMLEARKQ